MIYLYRNIKIYSIKCNNIGKSLKYNVFKKKVRFKRRYKLCQLNKVQKHAQKYCVVNGYTYGRSMKTNIEYTPS